MTSSDDHVESVAPQQTAAQQNDAPARQTAAGRENDSAEAGSPSHIYLLCDKGGWERIGPITRRLVVGLADAAMRVSLICDHDCPANIALPGLQGTHNLPKQGYHGIFRRQHRLDDLVEFAKRTPPTCIHAATLSSLPMALQMRELFHVPLLVTVDTVEAASLDLLAGVLAEDCRAVTMSTKIQEALLARLGGDANRAAFVEIIRPGVHVQERQRAAFEPGSPISLLVLEPATRSAGMEVVLKALAQLLQGGINVMLFFIGSGPDETHLRRTARELQVAEHITFTGRFIRWPQTLGAADIVLLPRPQQEMNIYPLEAMASGTLTVAAAGHCYDTIIDGKTGLEFEAGRDANLAEKLIETLRDPQHARTLGYAAQEKIRREHSVSRMIAAYTAMYETLGKVRLAGPLSGGQAGG